MESIYNLPLDVLRLLFEFSASISFESAKALSLTSKEVQVWADPYIFRAVQGSYDKSSGASGTSLLEQLYMSNASPRIILARNYVRAIAWKHFVPQVSSVEIALKYFPNLKQICLWNNLFPFHQGHRFDIIQNYPSLRRVITCLEYQSNIPQNAFGTPFWMSITHLQVNYYAPITSSSSPFQRPLFATMPSLTHLALSGMRGNCSEPDVDLAFSYVRESFPPSLTLCLLSLVAPTGVDRSHRLTEMVTASGKTDERIVVWSFIPDDNSDEIVVTNGGFTYAAWCKARGEIESYWEAGETILKRRQERVRAA